jgi:hypothetical protein
MDLQSVDTACSVFVFLEIHHVSSPTC